MVSCVDRTWYPGSTSRMLESVVTSTRDDTSLASTAKATSTWQPTIQALRAFAVVVVVLNHLWPQAIPGGYIGVDVFFVISGYLITGHLLGDLNRNGRVGLRGFWARRARRLLPASFLVLTAVSIATWTITPKSEWQGFFRTIAGSAGYVVNWLLAGDSVDYLADQSGASPVQHFWSLSAEEQFYLIWPLLIVAGIWLAARRRSHRSAVIAVVLAAVTIASFVTCVIWTNVDPLPAYFVTPTRAWEFGLGGLIAMLAGRLTPWLNRRGSIAGVFLLAAAAVLVFSAFRFNADTEFPGWRALVPTVGAAVFLLVGASIPPRLTRAIGNKPTLWLGDVSYSLYLWHWPLIVFIPFLTRKDLDLTASIVALALSLLLAGLTTKFVENPFRRNRRIVTAPLPLQYAGIAAGMAILIGASTVTWVAIQNAIDTSLRDATALEASLPPCFGAAATTAPAGTCSTSDFGGHVYPDRFVGQSDASIPSARHCRQLSTSADVLTCRLSEGSPGSVRVALVGDSHAEHWAPALVRIADERGWTLDTFLKGGCPFSTAVREADPRRQASCAIWNKAVVSRLAQGGYDLVVTSQLSGTEFVAAGGRSGPEAAVAGLIARWTQVRDETHATVVALRDPPVMGFNVPRCLSGLGGDIASRASECARPESAVIRIDPQVAAAHEAGFPLIDLTDRFCIDRTCPSVIGSVIVYRDTSHLGGLYARTLAPFLAQELDRVLDSTFASHS